ncbi:MAG: hypothetical protein JZU52_12540 [Lamprocystis purpurea]|jgi:hypothetical protein|uniref:hypothetical protein n=1 Tax=Lamprocystis purpurea TaxID=61598 RepID=UPI000365CBCF|nr:hypothetical protein [Lamprocystis purpurea]MBV5274423.1 hypothetical protein [Lamprocystis purpurea]
MSITQAAIDAGIIDGEIVAGSAGTALPEGPALRTRYVDPENPANVYDGGILPEWMRTKMQEQGYNPNAPADREAFKANYLSGPVRGRRRTPREPLTDAERTRAEEDASIAEIERTGTALVTAGPGTDLVPAAMDGEWISREAQLATLEREADDARAAIVHAHYEYGTILRKYRGLCDADDLRFRDFLERQGLSRSTAYGLIQVADAVDENPALRHLAANQYCKVLSLIQGISGDDLAKVVDGTHPTLTLDEVELMPVRKLKDELRRRRTDTQRIVAEETKTLRSENDALRDDLAQAHAALDGDVAQARKTARALREAVQTLAETADRLIDQLAPLPSGDLRGLRLDLESCISSGSIRLKDLWANWQDRVLDLGLDD